MKAEDRSCPHTRGIPWLCFAHATSRQRVLSSRLGAQWRAIQPISRQARGLWEMREDTAQQRGRNRHPGRVGFWERQGLLWFLARRKPPLGPQRSCGIWCGSRQGSWLLLNVASFPELLPRQPATRLPIPNLNKPCVHLHTVRPTRLPHLSVHVATLSMWSRSLPTLHTGPYSLSGTDTGLLRQCGLVL